jgi:hypothetical protein
MRSPLQQLALLDDPSALPGKGPEREKGAHLSESSKRPNVRSTIHLVERPITAWLSCAVPRTTLPARNTITHDCQRCLDGGAYRACPKKWEQCLSSSVALHRGASAKKGGASERLSPEVICVLSSLNVGVSSCAGPGPAEPRAPRSWPFRWGFLLLSGLQSPCPINASRQLCLNCASVESPFCASSAAFRGRARERYAPCVRPCVDNAFRWRSC